MGLDKKIATTLAVAAALACGAAHASEDYDLRYAPGIGGADMSAPFEAGWVFQAPAYVYSGHVSSTLHQPVDLSSSVPGASALATIDLHTQINVHGLLPRLSFMSDTKFLGAQVGGTALLPIVTKRASTRVTGVSSVVNAPGMPASVVSQLEAGTNAAVTQGANVSAADNSNEATGIGDLELSPILRWSTDASQTLFVLTVVAPTGDFRADRAANPGAGRFWTLRPALQYSYIGDGWDFGGRLAYSINTRDHATQYRTGNYLNVDATLMKSLNDSTRVGLSGYAVAQTTRDTSQFAGPTSATDQAGIDEAARQGVTVDQKGHVYGLGPEVAYIHGAGDYLLEGRFMKEFAGSYRPQGFTAIVTLSKPF